MKIRIKGNSIRYRLTQTEVQTLSKEGILTEETCFGPEENQKLLYSVEAKQGIPHLDAAFQHNRITLYIPGQDAGEWPTSERVGFQHHLQVTPETSLFLLLEKDFVCLDDVAEDQSDNYPNPRYEKRD